MCFYRPWGKVMFSQVSVCPQSASWLLGHCSSLLWRGRYASLLECILVRVFFSSIFCTIFTWNDIKYQSAMKALRLGERGRRLFHVWVLWKQDSWEVILGRGSSSWLVHACKYSTECSDRIHLLSTCACLECQSFFLPVLTWQMCKFYRKQDSSW